MRHRVASGSRWKWLSSPPLGAAAFSTGACRVPRPVAYIAELLPPSAELIDKIHRKHNVTLDEIREAVILTDVESPSGTGTLIRREAGDCL